MRVQRHCFIFLFLLFSFLIWKGWNIKIDNIKFQEILINQNSLDHKYTFPFLSYTQNKKNCIYIKTDVMSASINLHNGNIQEVRLLQYHEKINSFKTLKLLTKKNNFIYKIQSGLFEKDRVGLLKKNEKLHYISYRTIFKLVNGQKILYVPITCVSETGIKYTKIFVFKQGSYGIHIKYKIYNFTQFTLQVGMFGRLQQKIDFTNKNNLFNTPFSSKNVKDIAYSDDHKNYNKCSINNILNNKNIYITSYHGWIAVLQQYFTIAWVLNLNNENIIHTYCSDHKIANIEYISSSTTILPNKNHIVNSILWLGPKMQHKMLAVAPGLDTAIDYGWLWFLTQPLFTFLNIIHNIIGNWGSSIILITLIMRILTFPLTKSQYISIAKMKMLEPKINYLKEKFKNDKINLNKSIMQLYKNEHVNPFGGFLPVFFQMPIFLSLYSMLVSSIELRHAPFMFWIYDLSDPDPWYILPIIMGITMFYVQKTSPTSHISNDTIQRNMMNIIPILFTLCFLWFPSGLVIYYIASNIVTVVQQIIIYQDFKKHHNIKK